MTQLEKHIKDKPENKKQKEQLLKENKKCKYCGKPYKLEFKLPIGYLLIPDCDCEEKKRREREEREEKERRERIEKYKREHPAPKCKYCGKPYKLNEIFTEYEYIPACDCIEKAKQAQAEREKAEQEAEQRIKTSFLNSKLPPKLIGISFNDIDKTPQVKSCIEYVKDFTPKKSKGMQMVGHPGTGKTTALACICNYLITKGYKVLFMQMSALLDRMLNISEYGDYSKPLSALTQYDFIALDDIGRETYTDKRKELVFRIIDTLINYEIVTAVTANPESIAKLKNINELRAVVDRLRQLCPLPYEFKGESYRGKQDVTTNPKYQKYKDYVLEQLKRR